jgi:methyl-accepting chemotaxis protein
VVQSRGAGLYASAGHPWQVDLHMYFFACLAVLAGWCDWRVILAVWQIRASTAASIVRITACRTTRPRSPPAGKTAAGMAAVLLYASAGHPWQVDLHMYFFACLAVLAGWCDGAREHGRRQARCRQGAAAGDQRQRRGDRDVRPDALALVGMAAVLLYASAGHPWQVDLHMYFFACLAAIGSRHHDRVAAPASTAAARPGAGKAPPPVISGSAAATGMLYASAGHPWQVDLHMYFFACLAVLAGWCDWRVTRPPPGPVPARRRRR